MIYKFNKESIYNKYSEIINFGRNGNIIEIDESKLWKRMYNRGHGVDDIWIFGAVECHTRTIFVVSGDAKK